MKKDGEYLFTDTINVQVSFSQGFDMQIDCSGNESVGTMPCCVEFSGATAKGAVVHRFSTGSQNVRLRLLGTVQFWS